MYLEYINNKYNIIMGYSLKKKERVLERWSFVQLQIITCMSVLLYNIAFNNQ